MEQSALAGNASVGRTGRLLGWLLVVALAGTAALTAAAPPEGVRIIVLDVGQADAALVLSPSGQSLAIDAGGNDEAGESILKALRAAGRTRVEYLVISHYDRDHLGGADRLLEALGPEGVGAVLDPGVPAHVKPGWNDYGGYVRAAGDPRNTGQGGKRRTIRSGQVLEFGPLRARCVVVNGDVDDGVSGSAYDVRLDLGKQKHSNARSAGVLLTCGQFEYLTCGDITSNERQPESPGVEKALVAARALYNTSLTPPERRNQDDGRVDVYHVDHHGSDGSSGPKFVRAIGPRVPVISCGGKEAPNSQYRHPRPDVLALLAEVGAQTYVTGAGNVSAGDYSLGAASWRLPASVHLGQGEILIQVSADGSTYRVWPREGQPSPELRSE
jgi:competence protein ComEC